MFFFFFSFLTRVGSDVFFTRCLENCLCCRIFLFLPPTLLSRSHPSASCSFLLFPLSPWHPNLQSDFILSPHQSHKREGAVSSASLSSSLPLFLYPTRVCIAPSRPPAKALMLQKVLQKKYFFLYIHIFFFFIFFFSILPSFPSIIFSLSLCLRMVLYLNGLSASLSSSLCLSLVFKISIPLLGCT